METKEKETAAKGTGEKEKKEEEEERSEAREEATVIALTRNERIGGRSPMSLLSSDGMLLRMFCEEYLPRDGRVEELAGAAATGEAERIAGTLERVTEGLEKRVREGNQRDAGRFVRAGGLGLAVELVARHRGSAGVAEWGSGLVMVLAFAREERQREVAEAGGVEAIVSAMRAHPGNGRVQELGAAALWNVSSSAVSLKRRVAAAGGVEAIIAAMRAHGDAGRTRALENCCGALSSLTYIAELQAAVGEQGGVGLVVGALRENAGNAGVVEQALFATWTITIDPANKTRAAEAGLVEHAIAAMRRHGAVANVQRAGAATLWNLAADFTLQRRVAEAGGIGVLLEAMSRAGKHGADREVCEMAVGALKSILSTPEQHAAFASEEVVRAARDAAERFPRARLVVQSAEAIGRVVDAEAARAEAEGVCTLVRCPRCPPPPCEAFAQCWCPSCSRNQRFFQCVFCDGRRSNLRYCASCATRCHRGHEMIESFTPGTCDCGNSRCKVPLPKV